MKREYKILSKNYYYRVVISGLNNKIYIQKKIGGFWFWSKWKIIPYSFKNKNDAIIVSSIGTIKKLNECIDALNRY